MRLRDCPAAVSENESTTRTSSLELGSGGRRKAAKAEVLASPKTYQHPAWERQPEPVDLEASREVRRSELVRI